MSIRVFYLILFLFFSINLSAQQFRYASALADLDSYGDNSGVAVADYDQDGDLDVFLVSRRAHGGLEYFYSKLLRNENNGKFIDATFSMGVSQDLNYEIDSTYFLDYGERQSASWGDINNDGLS